MNRRTGRNSGLRLRFPTFSSCVGLYVFGAGHFCEGSFTCDQG